MKPEGCRLGGFREGSGESCLAGGVGTAVAILQISFSALEVSLLIMPMPAELLEIHLQLSCQPQPASPSPGSPSPGHKSCPNMVGGHAEPAEYTPRHLVFCPTASWIPMKKEITVSLDLAYMVIFSLHRISTDPSICVELRV